MAFGYTTVIQQFEIPADYANFEVSVVLQGNEYYFGFQYNTRGEYWALTIYDADRNVRIAGRKIVADWPVLAKIPQARIEYGILQAESKNGATDVPYDIGAFETGDIALQFTTLENDG